MRRAGAVIAVMLAATTAAGHGLPPMTNGVYFAADDPNSLYVATTFGFLISHDAGCTFQWVCEASVGYKDPYEPRFAVAHDGTIFATSIKGLRVSRDGGCSFATASAARFVAAVAIGPTGEVMIATSEDDGSDDVFVSTDNAMTFAPSALPGHQWTSVAAAPSDPQRAYALGRDVTSAHLQRRDASGWTEVAMAGVQVGPSPTVTIGAVDPTNRDVLYLVSTTPAGDLLYRSSDGGATFAQVFATGHIHDVLVRDAQTTYVTTMVSAGSVLVGGPAYRSTNGGLTFDPLATAPELLCLGVAPDGALVGCGHNWEPDFMAIARSTDGDAWTKVFRFVEFAGALDCPASTAVVCEQSAADVVAMFDATGPVCGAHVAPDAGPDVQQGPGDKPPGCCDAGDAPSLVWALAVGGVLVRRRRR